MDGSDTTEFENGVMRTRRRLTADGVRHTAYVDAVPGYRGVHVTYFDGSGSTAFALADNAAAPGTASVEDLLIFTKSQRKSLDKAEIKIPHKPI
ncbi:MULTISPECIES: hypothetical protein [unclassified Paracoccus (in: a-proteobacteria)]|uniref:hypothetical protein n=1 Tax=unclassified Paracoccus (in: a-proteobacteria) TaxID=2688777 RepID=UPI00112CD0F1|nr:MULTISPECIES: hypothetical protein [unclassified Paracoccus (in: a-proteobacteria)]MBT0778440.1 hypothetical protein [Paracoccus sp. pheM1]